MPLNTVVPALFAQRKIAATQTITGVVITRVHALDTGHADVRIGRVVTAEILTEEEYSVDAEFFLLRNHRQHKRQTEKYAPETFHDLIITFAAAKVHLFFDIRKSNFLSSNGIYTKYI